MKYNGIKVQPIYLFDKTTNYAVSNDGRVFNIKYNRELKNKIDSKGYYVVTLSVNGVAIDQRVHRLVAKAYIPNPDDLPIVNHKDGNKLNPLYTNLEWTTAKGNAEHASKTGLLHAAKLEDHGKASLTNQQVSEICELMELGTATQREIAKLYNTSEVIIREIRLGHNWVEISKNYKISNCKMIANDPISDDIVIKIADELINDKLTIKEIANKFSVTPFVVLSIYKKRNHVDIIKDYDFSVYSKRCRYNEDSIKTVRELISKGVSSSEIISETNLPKGSKTNTFLYRQRKHLEHEKGNSGY